MEDIQQIRLELEQMKRDLTKDAPGNRGADAGLKRHKRPCLDVGLFLLSYFFWLVLIVTAELAAGIAIHPYTVFAALPFAWATIIWLRGAPLYALLITAIGALLLAAASFGVSLLYDTAWNSSSYYKPVTGMLVNGWNPFRQTFAEFANTTSVLPYNDGWLSYQLGSQPKAAFMIGAAFYALTGSIESGKLFNLISLIACVLIAAPMLTDAFKLGRPAAFLTMVLACAGPIVLSQLALYYYDGFAFQMLTVAVASFAYILFKPDGSLAGAAKAAAFMAVGIAVNLSPTAAILAVILCAVFGIARMVLIWRLEDEGDRLWPTLGLLLYLVLMAACALLALGASTYLANFLRTGNPFYGMAGQSAMNNLPEDLMSPEIRALPLIVQFFISMFSSMSAEAFTQIDLKIPFTVSRGEWALSTTGANVAGWGILFGGIFLLSVLVVLVTALRMLRRSPRVFWLLIGMLAIVILPPVFMKNLYNARDYLLPFLLPMTALACLFAPAERMDNGAPRHFFVSSLKFILAPILCALMIVNAYTGTLYLRSQAEQTAADKVKTTEIKTRIGEGDTEFDVTTIARGLFYGLFFNLKDAGVEYNFSESLPRIRDELLYYMVYAFRDRGAEQDAQAETFINSLYSDEYLVVIASGGGSPLPDGMAALLQNVGLMADGSADPAEGYLAAIGPDGTVLVEENGFVSFRETVEETDLSVISARTGVSIVMNGTEYGDDQSGFHIVVYDTKNALPVALVLINPDADPVMTTYPVRIPAEND